MKTLILLVVGLTLALGSVAAQGASDTPGGAWHWRSNSGRTYLKITKSPFADPAKEALFWQWCHDFNCQRHDEGEERQSFEEDLKSGAWTPFKE